MNLKKISALAAGVALTLGMAASAQAVTLTAGNIKLTINNYDSGTTGYETAAPFGFSTVCNTALTCDAAGTLPSVNGIGSEDSWGIFSIANITRISDNSIIWSAGAGEYLTGIFGGLADTKVEVLKVGSTADHTFTYAEGGWLKLFKNTADYNANVGPFGRIGVDGFDSISNTGGTLMLDAVFGAGVLFGDTTHTYASDFANAGISGHGQGYLDVVGGEWGGVNGVLNSNSLTDPNGGKHDLFLDTTYHATPEANALGWAVVSASQVDGRALPEPGSIALFGLGLAGLAALRRRKA